MRNACPGVAVGSGPGAPRVSILLYADDVVILAESPEDLQRALDAATAWAHRWRFNFNFGED